MDLRCLATLLILLVLLSTLIELLEHDDLVTFALSRWALNRVENVSPASDDVIRTKREGYRTNDGLKLSIQSLSVRQ